MHQSNHQLEATLNSLGYLEDDKYYKSRDCLNAAKDIIRFLRHDDERVKSTRLQLLDSGVITNDFIPIIKTIDSNKDEQLFDIILRLLVNLTQSAITCYDHKIPTDKIERNVFIQIDNYLRKAKDTFSDEKFIRILNKKLNEILSKDWKNRPEEEEHIIERILFLLRNMLMIKEGTDDDDGENITIGLNSHDMLISSLDKCGLFDTIIKLSSSSHEPKYMIHLLEIMNFILRDRSARELGQLKETSNAKRSQVEKDEDNDELLKLQLKDKHMRQHQLFNLNPRHSRFVGTFVATNIKSISDKNNQICHKPMPSVNEIFDDSTKKRTKKAKNRIAVEVEEKEIRSSGLVKVILTKFCKSFFKNCYNTYMLYLNDMLQRKRLEDDEIASYFWLIKFFMEFNRNTDELKMIKLERMRQTFSLEMLHSIEVFITRCVEMLAIEKQDATIWIKRMHTCLNCYKEYLFTLKSFETKSNELTGTNSEIILNNENQAGLGFDTLNEEAKELITKIKNQIFYIQEFRELFINIMKDFNEAKTTKLFLKDVIEANHIFLEMLEMYLNENSDISVQKKVKGRRKSKTAKKSTKKSAKKKSQKTKEANEIDLRNEIEEKFELFERIEPKLIELLSKDKEVFKAENQTDEILFQLDYATSDKEIDAQKDKAIKKIQTYIRSSRLERVVLLYREAKYIWPNAGDLFGDDTLLCNEELEKIKDLFMRHYDENDESGNDVEDVNDDDDIVEEDAGCDDLMAREFGDDDADDDTHIDILLKEESLDFLKFFTRYTHSRIIKVYVYILGDYASNTDHLNNCILKFFDRIVNQCNLPQYLYQLSLFNLIDKMHKDPLRKCLNVAVTTTQSTIFEFFQKLLANFFEDLKTNQKLLLEVLFLKDKKIVVELNEGYGATAASAKSGDKKGIPWTSDDIDELRELYEKYKNDAVGDTLDENFYDPSVNTQRQKGDVVDRIMIHMKVCNRKRKDICLQLVRIGAVDSVDVLKENSEISLGRSRIWRDEDVDDLKWAFENVQIPETVDRLNVLKQTLKIKRSKKDIIDKLLELGMIQHKSEVTGKKVRDKKKSRNELVKSLNDIVDAEGSSGSSSSDSSGGESDDDDDGGKSSESDKSNVELNLNEEQSGNKNRIDEDSNSKSPVAHLPMNESSASPQPQGKPKELEKSKALKANFKRRMYNLDSDDEDQKADEQSSDNSSSDKPTSKKRASSSSESSNDENKENSSAKTKKTPTKLLGNAEDDDEELTVQNRSKRQRLIIDSDSD